jgi:hypothetical protein
MTKTHCKRGHDTTLPESRYKNGTCKACMVIRNKARDASPEKKAYIKSYRATPKRKAYIKAYKASPKGKYQRREDDLKSRGWTPEMYDAAKLEQEGVCAICKQPPTGKVPMQYCRQTTTTKPKNPEHFFVDPVTKPSGSLEILPIFAEKPQVISKPGPKSFSHSRLFVPRIALGLFFVVCMILHYP